MYFRTRHTLQFSRAACFKRLRCPRRHGDVLGLRRSPRPSELIKLHTIGRVIACSFICNRDLACGRGTRLDCCDVNVTPGDYGIAIVTLGRLYFVLSYRLAPPDALSVLYERRTGSGATGVMTESHLSSGVGSEVLWARLLVSFQCEDTCHVVRSDTISNWTWTYRWNKVCGTPTSSLGGASSWLEHGSWTRLDTPSCSEPE
jgi:hypothetical protein